MVGLERTRSSKLKRRACGEQGRLDRSLASGGEAIEVREAGAAGALGCAMSVVGRRREVPLCKHQS